MICPFSYQCMRKDCRWQGFSIRMYAGCRRQAFCIGAFMERRKVYGAVIYTVGKGA